MAFTYNLDTVNDITRVRYHLQDTDEATAIFSDEEIQFRIDEEGSVAGAVVSLIRAIIGKLSHEPDMQADWLRVSWRANIESWRKMLSEKSIELGVGLRVRSRTRRVYRADYGTSDSIID